MVAAAAVAFSSPVATARAAAEGRLGLFFCCDAQNDLYRVATTAGTTWPRYDEPVEAELLILGHEVTHATETLYGAGNHYRQAECLFPVIPHVLFIKRFGFLSRFSFS